MDEALEQLLQRSEGAPRAGAESENEDQDEI
jgi:hypothetical protein